MKVSDVPDAWSGPTLWGFVLNVVVAVAAFIGGVWSRGSADGKVEGASTARMDAISSRMTIIEGRHLMIEDRLSKTSDRLDEKISKMAERLSATPTRDEILAQFARLENKLDMHRASPLGE